MRLVAEHLCWPKQGESVSGDAAIFRRVDGVALFAVIDALGHGAHAFAVAEAGVAYLRDARLEDGALALMNGLHRALSGTRGAASMLCTWRAGRVEGCGVGNVELATVDTKLPITLTPGILGVRMRPLRAFEGAAGVGSRFVLYSDGISTAIGREDLRSLPRTGACRALMDKHRKPHDDATVMVVDVENEQ